MSIPTEAWQVNADDPLALTHVLGLPEFRVTRLEFDDHLEHILVFCARADDLAWAGNACYLIIGARRFTCRQCRKPFTETLQAIAPHPLL